MEAKLVIGLVLAVLVVVSALSALAGRSAAYKRGFAEGVIDGP